MHRVFEFYQIGPNTIMITANTRDL